jgi:nucleoid-associated protein YgaU
MTANPFTDLPTALLHLNVLLLVTAVAWGSLVALLASWPPTRRLALALTPQLVRATVLGTISGTLAVGPAHAGVDLDGLPFPDRGITAQPTAARSSTDHTVEAGETLWSIASEALGSNATPATTAEATSAWFAANRHTIGSDPNLIHPGQRLVAPGPEARP